MNLRLPITIRDCKPDALIKWIMLADVIKEKTKDGEPSFVDYIEFQCQLLSVFSKVSISKIKKGHIDDVQFAAQLIMQMLSEYKSEDPSGEIVIDGKKYIFDLDFGNITTGQIIDLKLIEDVASDPCRALAICYVEEGMDYCHEDDKGRILNPTAKRYEIFKERFPGDEFLNYFGFFFALLRKAEQRYIGDSDVEDGDDEQEKSSVFKNSEWFVWTSIIHRLSKELGCGLEKITGQPYIKTLFWINYFKILDEQNNILK